MSNMQRATTETINSVLTRARIRLRRADLEMSIKAESKPGKPFQWTVIIGWWDKAHYTCQIGIADDIHDAVERCLDKIPVAPNLAAVLGYTEVSA